MEGGACKSDTARSTADVVVESRRGSKSAVVVERRPRYSAADVVEKGKRDYRAYYTRETSLSPFITFPLWFLAFIMGITAPVLLAYEAYRQEKPWLMVMCITPMFIMLATPFTSTSAALACTSAKPKKGDYERTAENIAGIKALIASNKAPAVDLLIPCCSEPLEVVQDTTLAALHQTYPHDAYTVYVLDDGGNDALRDWTEKLAAEMKQSSGGLRRLVYVRREKTKGVPHHYKAGNMNYTLRRTNAPYVAQLDADMIPSPHFLTRLMADMHADPKLAYVFCPQTFYNCGPMDVLDDQQGFTNFSYYPRLCNLGVVPNGGSGVIFRRAALNQLGGFATESLGEDYLTSFYCQLNGWESRFVRDPLQMGLVPWTLEGWLKQHQRWTTSNMEILNIIWNKILFSRGRYSLRQKWIIMAWAMQQLLMPFTFMLSWVQMAAMVVMSNKDLGPAVWLHDGVLFRISLVIGVIATMLQDAVALLLTADVPWAFSMFVRGKVALAFESPYKTLWVVRFLLRLPAGWSPTGNLLKRSQLLSHIKLCWYHLLVAVSAVAVTTYSIISALSFCRNPFQLGLRIFGVASMVLGFPLTLLPALFYMFKFPKPVERRSMLPRDSAGVPLTNIGTVWPPWDTLMFVLMAVPTLVNWGGAIMLAVLAIWTPLRGEYC